MEACKFFSVGVKNIDFRQFHNHSYFCNRGGGRGGGASLLHQNWLIAGVKGHLVYGKLVFNLLIANQRSSCVWKVGVVGVNDRERLTVFNCRSQTVAIAYSLASKMR